MKIKNLIFPALTVLITALCFYKINSKCKNVEAVQQGLSDSLVRFHVISAGNSEYEQALKLLVKNSVLELLSEKMTDMSTKEETLNIITELTPEITDCARLVLLENGCDMKVTVNIEESFFPIKTYGDLTLPAGRYTALKIVLGEGKGTNWWCVLYPRLCFVDATYGVVPNEAKAEFKTILSDEEYNSIFNEKIVFRFKILKFLNQILPDCKK